MGGKRGRWRKEPWRERGQGGGDSMEKEVVEEWERGVETPGTSEGSQADERARGGGGQATKGKATGREEKWGKEGGRRVEKGQMAMRSLGSGSKGGRQAGGAGHKRAGSQTELPKRRSRWRNGVETQWGKRQRERELERAGGRPWGGERGGGRGQGARWVLPALPPLAQTGRWFHIGGCCTGQPQ